MNSVGSAKDGGKDKGGAVENGLLGQAVYVDLQTQLELGNRLGSKVLVDNHAHLNFMKNWQDVLQRFVEFGGVRVVDVACNLHELKISYRIAQAFPAVVRTSFALHPEFLRPNVHKEMLEELSPDLLEVVVNLGVEFRKGGRGESPLLYDLLNIWRVVLEQAVSTHLSAPPQSSPTVSIHSIGETGLDIYGLQDRSTINAVLHAQARLLELHLEFAQKHQLPVVLHVRGATNSDTSIYLEAHNIVKQFTNLPLVYYHSFVGDIKTAKTIAQHYESRQTRLVFGFNGIATYSSAKHLQEVIKWLPLNKILIETDSPFLIPKGFNRKRLLSNQQNEPITVSAIKDFVVRLKGACRRRAA